MSRRISTDLKEVLLRDFERIFSNFYKTKFPIRSATIETDVNGNIVETVI